MILASGNCGGTGLLLSCLFKWRYSTNSPAQRLTADIVLYKNHSRPKFVLLISTAAGVQLLFWSYLSYSALQDYYTATVTGQSSALEVQPADKSEAVRNDGQSLGPLEVPAGRGLEEKVQVLQSKSSLKWRVAFSLLALSVGAFFGLTALMYPKRMVNNLVFNRQSNVLTISTYTPTGGIHQSKVSVVDVQSTIGSSKASHYALRVKGHRLFYLLDKKGEFPNLKLFDTLIGIRTH